MTGSGTLADPFIISDVDDLQAMENDLTAYYELANNIDALATSGWNGGLGFDPIGTYDGAHPEYAFRGNFDGKGFKITDLFINRPTKDYVGLFGYTGLVGGYAGDMREMKNVGLEDVDITGDNYSIAGLVGFHDHARTFTNCWVTGAIKTEGASRATLVGGLTGYVDGQVTDCYFSGTIVSAGGFNEVGGLIGLLGGGSGVLRCYSTGTMSHDGGGTQDDEYVGGLIGDTSTSAADITKCYSTMDIEITNADDVFGIGCLVGSLSNAGESITDCYARGDVTANGAPADTKYIGGFVGYSKGTITNCYSTGLVTSNGLTFIGGFCGGRFVGSTIANSFWDTETSGQAASDGGAGKTTAQMKTESTFTDAGWDFTTVWAICSGVNGDYPCLVGVTPSCSYSPVVPLAIKRAYALAREEL